MNFEPLRRRMVQDQLIKRGIHDPRVLAVMEKLPRHLFVPLPNRHQSYGDHPVSIGEGQTVSQPYIVALMTQELNVCPKMKVLEIGTGSGYQTAILADLEGQVYSIERIVPLAHRAEEILKRLGYTHIQTRIGDGTVGWPQEAPFERILVTAHASSVPPILLEQLSDGGRMVIPVGSSFDQVLTLVEKAGKEIRTQKICGCVFVPLIGAQGTLSSNE